MTRAEELAAALERAVDEFAGLLEGLSEAEWRTVCPGEQRSVAALAFHVAKGIPFEMAYFRQFAAGVQPPLMTWAQLDAMNAADAAAWDDCDRDETVALLRVNAAEAAREIRGWSDAQLARRGSYLEGQPEPWPVADWLSRVLAGHVTNHLRSIRAALTGAGGAAS